MGAAAWAGHGADVWDDGGGSMGQGGLVDGYQGGDGDEIGLKPVYDVGICGVGVNLRRKGGELGGFCHFVWDQRVVL